jgi:uncharacterized protein
VTDILDAPPLMRPRLIRGEAGWWYLGTRGLLLLHPTAVAEGRPSTAADRQLRAAGVDGPAAQRAYSLTVLTTTTCNLGCAYCFQNAAPDPVGGTRPPRIASSSLSRDTVRRILAFTDARMAEAGLDQLDLHLFGGEPLLNPDGCRYLLAQAADHGLAYAWMTSNGTLLTPELAGELADLGLRHVQVTFDGGRTVHDDTRVRRSGGGTFDDILTNMAAATEASSLRWLLRVNVTEHNRHGIDGMLADIAARVDPARCRIGFSVVDDVGIGFTDTAARSTELVAAMAGWTIRAAELGFRIGLPMAAQACLSCSVPDGGRGTVVNADGVLYSCWESAGKPGWEVGTVDTGYLPADQVTGRWVACGHDSRNADRSRSGWFQDAVDAKVLDHLHATGKLRARQA